MAHGTLLQVERFRDGDDSEFRVPAKREILRMLEALCDEGTRIALYCDNQPEFILTTLLATDANGLWLDVGPHAPENKRFLQGEKVTFVTAHKNVKVQFTTNDLESTIFEGAPAFFIKLPSYLLRIQRREHFRLSLPTSNPIKCTIPVAQPKPDVEPMLHTIAALDLSGGGVGLLCRDNETELVPGKSFSDCKITLPDTGVLTVSLNVRNNVPLPTLNNTVKQRAGCQFMHLDNQMNMLLQRYLTLLERRALATR